MGKPFPSSRYRILRPLIDMERSIYSDNIFFLINKV
jgi:hypothetical protein